MIPLAPSFDAPGLIAPTLEQLRRVDMALVYRDRRRASPRNAAQVHVVVPRDAILAGATDRQVLDRFDHWLSMLTTAGVRVTEADLPVLTEASIAAREGFVIAVEAYDWHRDLIATSFDRYDPRVGPRIQYGATVLAADYVKALRRIGDCRRRFDTALDDLDADAIVTPTVPVLPPRVADVDTMDAYLSMNTEVLRLTEFANRLDLPSVTMPGSPVLGEPIGVMLTGRRGDDSVLLDLAVLVESVLGERLSH